MKKAEKQGSAKHDVGYKGIFSNKEKFLYFLVEYLGLRWLADISADDIERVDTTYITNEYRHIDSDLIYKLKVGDEDVYFYVLLELQSRVDFTMPFRLLRYMVELLNDVFKNTPESVRESKDFRLPAIMPVVMYNGADNWTAARSFREYTANWDVFGGSLIDFRYELFDLNSATIPATQELLDVILLLDKRRLDGRALTEITEDLTESFPKLTGEDLSTLFNWMKHVYYRGNISPESEKKLKQYIEKGDINAMKHGIEILMDEERRQWKKEGQVEGRMEGRVEVARRLKEAGVDLSTIALTTDVPLEDIMRM